MKSVLKKKNGNSIEIKLIKIDNGYLVSMKNGYRMSRYYFDGKLSKETHNDIWSFIEKRPKKIQSDVSQPNINYRYELLDEEMESEKIPLVLIRGEVMEYDDDDCDWTWKSDCKEYAKYYSLYKLVSDEQPDIKVNVEFTIVEEVEVSGYKKTKKFSFPTATIGYNKSSRPITNESVKSQLIDEIMFPDVVMHMRPSRLTPTQSYSIVRKHIQDNIDPKYATITSDHDFCFTVKKKIDLYEHEEYTVDLNLMKRTKRKRLETRYRKTREVAIYETSPEGYSKYPTIKGFEGKDDDDLVKNIKRFLKDLMKVINEPVVDCPHCKGRGVTFTEFMDNKE